MRILRGREKGRKLTPVKTKGIRPTRDNVKESIFSMIRGHVEGRTVLDLFAGTGNLGLEALSQGAKKATSAAFKMRPRSSPLMQKWP
jgi:16S rRNA (guanine(966)-N(2))-methyltransferase RsmD